MKYARSVSSLLGGSVSASRRAATTLLNQLVRTRMLILLACLCLSAHAQTAVNEALTDVFFVGIKSDYSANELIRIDKNGNQLWQTTVPVNGYAPQSYSVDRNLKEDSFYTVNTDNNGNVNGYSVLKFDANGNLLWQTAALSSKYTVLSANPVGGGVYIANGDGVSKIDANGATIWGPINWGHTEFDRVATDVTTGGVYVALYQEDTVIKADANGVELWELNTFPQANQIRSNPIDGGVYVPYSSAWYCCGSYYDERDIARLDSNGNTIWSTSGVPSRWNYGFAVSPLDGSFTVGSGWPFVTAKFGMNGQVVYENNNWGPFDIAPDIEIGGIYGSTSSGGCATNLPVIKLDNTMQLVWQKLIGNYEWNRYMIVATGVLPSSISVSSPPAATTTTLTSSPNPSVYGQAVTLTANVTSSVGAPPNGETVSFMNGATTLGTGTLSGGAASFITSALPMGADSITASYGGDTNFAASSSTTTLTVYSSSTVNPITTSAVSKVSNGYQVVITVTNTGAVAAANAQLTSALLGSAATSSSLPQNLGTLAAGGGSGTVTFTFPASAGKDGATAIVKASGTYTGGTFVYSLRAVLP